MYLKALEIQGFKSFPDKTVLQFGEEITAIVGPNGSGKSNISDAIRWVMGEQSSKNLRGAKMEDVIFGGTEKRSAVGFAQVTLVLDNSAHIFPAVDSPEVMVTRRYYRSGESEYYINKQSVRLKDINELFMDTGLGREGYSIIGQGRIDEILSVKSGDRREIFEEAAGISKFRHRKEETERKLERTEENLVRINDKIAELELQVEPLREQAEKAKRYLILRDELRVLEISVWLSNLEELKAKGRKLEADYAAAVEQQQQAQQALEELYAANEQFGERTRRNDMDQEAERREISDLEGQISEQDSATAVLRTRMEHNSESMERIGGELSDQDSRSENLRTQIEQQRGRIQEIAGHMDQVEQELSALLQRAQEAAEGNRSAAQEAERLRGQEALSVAAAADARAERSALTAGIAQMENRQGEVEAELASARETLEGKQAEAKQCRRRLEDAEEEAAAIRNVIAGHTMKLESREKRQQAAQDKKMKLTMDHQAMVDRITLLTEMEKEYEGFNKAVRLVMQAAEKNTLRGVHGPIASLMQVEDAYTVAIEIALGAGMQNIVVDREEDAKSAIQFLKQRDGGRATFLPLTAIRGEELRERGVESEFGVVGVASRLVRCDSRYDQVFRSLLGRTLVVEDLDCGIAMARKYQNRFRIVTLDGQVINRGGSMTGGSVSRSAGILTRANELAALRGKLEKMAQSLAQAAQEAEEAQRELTAARYEREVAEGQQRTAEDAVLKLQGEKGQYDVLLETLRTSLENLEGEREALAGRLKDAIEAVAEKEQEIARYDAAPGGGTPLRAVGPPGTHRHTGGGDLRPQGGSRGQQRRAGHHGAIPGGPGETPGRYDGGQGLPGGAAGGVPPLQPGDPGGTGAAGGADRPPARAGPAVPGETGATGAGETAHRAGAHCLGPGTEGEKRRPPGHRAGGGPAGTAEGHQRHGGEPDPGQTVGTLRTQPLRRHGAAGGTGERSQGDPPHRGTEAGNRGPWQRQCGRHRRVRAGQYPLHLPHGPAG